MSFVMYFDVYINETKLGTFGHHDVENLTISVSGAADGVFVFPTAVCREGNIQFHYRWADVQIGIDSEIRIVPSSGPAAEPIRRFEMGRTKRKAWDGNICEFCQRTETQVPKLVLGDEHRPGICSDCVKLCQNILSAEA